MPFYCKVLVVIRSNKKFFAHEFRGQKPLQIVFQVTGNSRNYKSARGKRPCPININERDTQTSNGHKPGSTLLDFSFMPTSQQDSMSSSCSEYDSEDNCSLSSNALGEFGGMTLSEIEQLAFNEGIGGTRSGSHAQTNSPSNAHAKSMANGAPLDSMSSVGHRFESSQGAADDADESDSDMDLSRSCSPYITTSLQVQILNLMVDLIVLPN